MSIDDSAATRPRQMVELDRVTAMDLLAGIGVGRIVFTEHALPAIRVVSHLVDNDAIIIRTATTSALAGTLDDSAGTVVAYEADDIDPVNRLGWSVIVTGIATPVEDRERATGYRDALQPWAGDPKDLIISILPQIVTGFRLAVTDGDVSAETEPAAGGPVRSPVAPASEKR